MESTLWGLKCIVMWLRPAIFYWMYIVTEAHLLEGTRNSSQGHTLWTHLPAGSGSPLVHQDIKSSVVDCMVSDIHMLTCKTCTLPLNILQPQYPTWRAWTGVHWRLWVQSWAAPSQWRALSLFCAGLWPVRGVFQSMQWCIQFWNSELLLYMAVG